MAAHSHIRALGLREDGVADQSAAGFIGQQQAREVTSPVRFRLIILGMRYCRRFSQGEENGRSRNVIVRRIRNRKNSISARHRTRVGSTSSILSYRWERSV